jgi:N-acetylmuramoyl-L-alanine amidase
MIREWHVARKFSTIGYHAVVTNGYPTKNWSNQRIKIPHLEGSVEIGRPIDSDAEFEDFEMGAHVKGANFQSFGICMIGKEHFSDKVLNTALAVVRFHMKQFSLLPENVLGHYEKDNSKTCPNIDMNEFRDHLKNLSEYGTKTISMGVEKEDTRSSITFSGFFNYIFNFFKGFNYG